MCGTVRPKLETLGTNESSVETQPIDRDTLTVVELEFEEVCVNNQYREDEESCNTWNVEACNSPCQTALCPLFALCVDVSNETDPLFDCQCQLGTVLSPELNRCIDPPPTAPTPRPYPTLPPAQEVIICGFQY